MKCNDVRTFFSQVAGRSLTMQIQQADLDTLSSGGYISMLPKEDYDKAVSDVSSLTELTMKLQDEENQARIDSDALVQDQKKTHSILFHFAGAPQKQAELQDEQSKADIVNKEQADIAQKESEITQLIQKKSTIDRMVQCGAEYVALTGLGVITLNDLNVRNYRVSDDEFSDYVAQSKETTSQLQSIAETGSYYASSLAPDFPKADPSQLWSTSIGLAKLQGDEKQIIERFLTAMNVLQHFSSTLENKMMAAEIMTASRANPSSSPGDNSDLEDLSKALNDLDNELRHDAHVPKQLSAGVATTILFGKRFDGTYPTDRFLQFSKMTQSFETAAILSVVTAPVDQLSAKFYSFRQLFASWGYQTSEDTELASAYLAISDLGPDDVKLKLAIIVNGMRNYLEYPLVASSILAGISTLEANETLDLTEKAYSILAPVATGLERPVLITLAVRMIHGIENELVKKLDSTAKIANTPVQLRYSPGNMFFLWYAPLILGYGAYNSTFSGIGGSHPAHVHGVGGFVG